MRNFLLHLAVFYLPNFNWVIGLSAVFVTGAFMIGLQGDNTAAGIGFRVFAMVMFIVYQLRNALLIKNSIRDVNDINDLLGKPRTDVEQEYKKLKV